MAFCDELTFNKEQYDTYLRRIHYDDRDAIMYENMLQFLWEYIIAGALEDREGLLEEYTHWNLQLIDKVYYRPHETPYAEIRRAYQSVIYLLDGKWQQGLQQLSLIRENSFSYDGYAPKSIMVSSGKVYYPCSRLFILYNYYKYFMYHGLEAEAQSLKEHYAYAFQKFGDANHEKHDLFLKEQLEEDGDKLFYPVFDRVYKLPRGPKDFFIYCDQDHTLPIGQ